MKRKNIIIILLAIILIGGLIYIAIPKDDIKEEGNDIKDIEDAEFEDLTDQDFANIGIGKEAPNFTLENLDGEFVSLEDYRGKIVLLNFWATWCPYCVKEMPDMNKLYNGNKNEDFVVIAVDVGESKSDVVRFVEKGGYDFEVLLDQDGDVATRYIVRGIPTSYMIDKEGKIRAIKLSMMSYPEMKQMLDSIKEK